VGRILKSRRRVPLVTVLLAVAPGCSVPSPAISVDAALDHGTSPALPDAVTAQDAGVDAAPLQTSIRVALLSSLGFGIDVCVQQSTDTPSQGPLLYNQHQLQTQPDAGQGDAGDGGHDAGLDTGGHKDAGSTFDGADGAVPPEGGAADGALEAAHDATVIPDATLDAARDATADDAGDSGASGDASSTMDAATPFGGVLAEQVTNYLAVDGAGTFTVTLVRGGSSSCGCGVGRRITLDPGKSYTLVVGVPTPVPSDAATTDAEGSSQPDAAVVDGGGNDASTCTPTAPLMIIPLTDEPALTPTAHARFFNATNFNPSSPDGGTAHPFRVAVVEANAIVPLAGEVPVGQASLVSHANPSVDTLGYWSGSLSSTTSLVDLRIGAPVDGGVDGGVGQPSSTFVAADDFDLAASTDHTGFIAGGGASPLTLLWCNDSTTIGAVYTSCEMFTSH
jgi:hypothetical protein